VISSVGLAVFPKVEPVDLNPLELAFCHWEDHRAAAFRAVALCRVDGFVESEFLEIALNRLQHRQPKLRAAVAQMSRGRSQLRFEQDTPPIPFQIKDHAEREGPWREETRRLFETTFPEMGPLVAVTVLRSRAHDCSEMLVTIHHAIADGLSAAAVLDGLLSEYAIAESRQDAPPRPPLNPVRVVRAKSSGGWSARIWLLRRLWRIQREQRRSPQTQLPAALDVPPQSQWVRWVFSPTESSLLLQRCKGEQTSLRAALAAAACCGLMDCLPVPRGSFKCQYPFDVRAMLVTTSTRLTLEDMGCFATIANDFYEVPQQPVFWDVARHTYEGIKTFVQHGGPAFYYNMAARLSKLSSMMNTSTSGSESTAEISGDRPTVVISNFGVLNIQEEYGSLRPTGCAFLFKHDGIGPSLMLHSLVMGAQLHISFSADRLDPTFWDRLHCAVLGHLKAAIR